MTATHAWFADPQPHDQPIVWSVGNWQAEGWTVEEEAGRFEVYYKTSEVMRLGADGSLSFGRQSYWFTTREWADLCVERLKSLDRAFGKDPSIMSLSSGGNFGIGIRTLSPFNKLEVRGPKFEPLVTMDQGGHITQLNMPALFMIWWRGTRVYAAWRVLLWGENA